MAGAAERKTPGRPNSTPQALDVIYDGSAVHCLTAQKGDVLLLGSDGVFDNLFVDELLALVNTYLSRPGGAQSPIPRDVLKQLAQQIVYAANKKSGPDGRSRVAMTPIGLGGKVDDVSVVVSEIVDWTPAHAAVLAAHTRQR